MNDADLEKLITKPVKLKPKFQRHITEYEVVLDSTVSQFKIDPMTRDCNASWQIIGIGTERSIAVEQGTTKTLTIEVTAEDGTTKNYNIQVVSLSPSSALLSSLVVKNQNIQPNFSSSTYKYECHVPACCASLRITTSVPDKTSEVNIRNMDDKNIMELNVGITNISINVTSPNKSNTVEYCLIIYREKFVFPVSISSLISCDICNGVIHNPTLISTSKNDSNFKCCSHCFMVISRTNKNHPFTREVLNNENIIEDLDCEISISNKKIKCPFACEMEVLYRELAYHVKDVCKNKFVWDDGKETLVYNNLKIDHEMNVYELCGKCSRKVCVFDKRYHDEVICNHAEVAKYKVVVHDWEKKMEQQVAIETLDDIIQSADIHENSYKEEIMKGNFDNAIPLLDKACEVFAYGVIKQPKKFEYHFRLGKLMWEMFHVTEIYKDKNKDDVNNNNDDDDFEFQTESSMIDDIKALTKQKGYNSNSTVDQLKALDEEYHYLLEQGQSDKADYIQKLYAYKQKQQLQDSSTGKKETILLTIPLVNDYLLRARQKFVDAASIESRDFQSQLYAGICYLMEGKFNDAFQILKYSVSLKPCSIEAKFYMAFAAMKCKSSDQYEEMYTQFILDGINLYIYENLHQDQQQNKFITDGFSNCFNIIVLQAIHELLKMKYVSRNDESLLYYGVTDLHHFVTSRAFDIMHKMRIRKHLFRQFQLLAFRQMYDFNAYMMGKTSSTMDIIEINKKSWIDLLSLLMHCCDDAIDLEFIQLKKESCENALRLQPRSSRLLYYLAEIYMASHQQMSSSSSSSVKISDIEKLYRCSIEVEGKDQNNGDIPELLKETVIWKQWENDLDKKKRDGVNNNVGRDKQSPVKKASSKTLKGTPPAAPGPSKVVARGRAKVANTKPSTNPRQQAATTKPAAARGVGRGRASSKLPPNNNPVSSSKSGPRNSKLCDAHSSSTSKDKLSITREECKKLPELLNGNIPEAYIGLANLLTQDDRNRDEAISLYERVIETAPHLHDSYIELGNIYAKTSPLEAVNVYCKYPFCEKSSYDDAFLHGEIVRILMKEEQFDDPRLLYQMTSLGKVMGFSYLDKYVAQLESKNKSKFLRELYCEVNNKSPDDSDVIAFFKFKLWL